MNVIGAFINIIKQSQSRKTVGVFFEKKALSIWLFRLLNTKIRGMVVLGIFDWLKENVTIFFCVFDIH
jgi:hypothetical protein